MSPGTDTQREVIASAWQKVEGGLVFLAGLVIYLVLANVLPWWAAILLFFAPDLSFAAYALGDRIGAAAYNVCHLYGVGAVLMAAGLVAGSVIPLALGALWLSHSGFDRMLGYGLKSPAGFAITHLGRIGRTR